jgi:hypothetical protein
MRSVPLIVLASAVASTADPLAARLREAGNVVYVTRSAEGCLRVATSVAPDVVVLDPELPPRLPKLLRAHPASARARIETLDAVRSSLRVSSSTVSSRATVGPRAA